MNAIPPDLRDTVKKLHDVSIGDFRNPYAAIDWPEKMDRAQWFTSPRFISLNGTPAYEALTEEKRKELSFFEAVNFYSLNIHGERPLCKGIAERLYRPEHRDVSPYLHHFLAEENNHMIYFATFCEKYAGKIYPDRHLAFPRDFADGEEDFLFFAHTLIFEEIVEFYNVKMSKDPALEPTARAINLLHHRDEARHLVFGRKLTKHLFQAHAPQWTQEVLAGVRENLSNFILSTWREYYNPDVYRDAGLPSPHDLREEAWNDPACVAHRREVSAGLFKYLLENKMLEKEPPLQ